MNILIPILCAALLQEAPADGGTRVKVTAEASRVKVSVGTVTIVESTKPSEVILPDVPPGRVKVEFLDPQTGASLGSVEFTPAPKAAPEPPPAGSDRVGQVQVVHRVFGVFVKLEPGVDLHAGEEITVIRDGKEVTRTKILQVCAADDKYPAGAVELPKESTIQKGDEVRRSK